MLFNSIPFLFAFLPLSLCIFFLLGRKDGARAKTALALLSFVFYAYWDYRYLPLLFASICLNFYIGARISAANAAAAALLSRRWLITGVLIDLGLLAFFKYANLLASTAHSLLDLPPLAAHILLPIGISFFTFTQIAFLVDAYQGKAQETHFWDYALFVSYFPHQIAGPILHHKEMMTQFRRFDRTRWSTEMLAVGLSILACGMVKKVLLADSFADIATPVFNGAETGVALTFFEAWAGTAAYALQLYFDFSAYCDMAIGVSLMFGIRLPPNFNSPYKATSIIDFWKRWHITLSRFLRDYLYIPLGGNRKGQLRRYLNLLATMALGGLWHGASWTFMVWGILHGLYLAINHLWREKVVFRPTGAAAALAWRCASWAITFLAVLYAWVFFRATTFHGALDMLGAMSGLHGISLPDGARHLASVLPVPSRTLLFDAHWLGSVHGSADLSLIVAGLLICLALPNTQQLFARYRPVLLDYAESDTPVGARQPLMAWRPGPAWAVPLAVLLGVAMSRLGNDSQFLYFNF